MWIIFPNLSVCLPSVLKCPTVLAASLLVQIIGTPGDLRLQIDRFFAKVAGRRRSIIGTLFTRQTCE
jgi:hypothetical protein